MSNAKERYQANRTRVFEIYGLDPNDQRYNCHHILFREDFREHPEWDKSYQDSKANLCPLTVEDHQRLHEMVDGIEERPRVLYQAPKRKRRPKHRLHDLKRLWQET